MPKPSFVISNDGVVHWIDCPKRGCPFSCAVSMVNGTQPSPSRVDVHRAAKKVAKHVALHHVSLDICSLRSFLVPIVPLQKL
jgi:hypothetical protein